MNIILSKFNKFDINEDVLNSEVIEFRIIFKQNNLQQLKEIALSVSNPKSSSYGDYLSAQQVGDMVGNEYLKNNFQNICNFFFSQDASVCEFNEISQQSLLIRMPLLNLQKILQKSNRNIKFHAFQKKSSNKNHNLYFRTLTTNYFFPKNIIKSSEISVITGIHDFFFSKKSFQNTRDTMLHTHNTKKTKSLTHTKKTLDNSPQVLPILIGSESTIAVDVAIYCKDGSLAQDPNNICSSFPPKVSSVELNLSDNVDFKKSIQANITTTTSTNQISCFFSNYVGGVVCQFHLFSIPEWNRLNVSSSVTYENFDSSSVGYYPTEYAPSSYVTPASIKAMYSIPSGLVASHPNNSQAVTAFEEQYISIKDLNLFFDEMGLEKTNPIIHGENNQSMPGGESTLDIQYIMGIGQGASSTFWSVSGDVKKGAYILEWAIQVSQTENPPLVTSISYGDTEDDYYNNYGSYNYIDQMEAQLIAMASRGLTVVTGSGDAGATNVGEDGNDIGPPVKTCDKAQPFYPADSPWTVGVSATFLSKNALPICEDQKMFNEPVLCGQIGEVPVSVSSGIFWTTGGGASGYLARPDYQKEAIDYYINNYKETLPPSDFFNISGTFYPDVSAIGHQLLMIQNGAITPVDGTSASSPITAGIITLLNDHQLHAGKPSLGFINPWLYQTYAEHPAAFKDVTIGSNYDGDIQLRGSPYDTFCPNGFLATPGYDAVTGLGTPNFPELVKNLP